MTVPAPIRHSLRGVATAAAITTSIVAALAVISLFPSAMWLRIPAALLVLLMPITAMAAGVYMVVRQKDAERPFWLAVAQGSTALLIGEVCDVIWRLDLLPHGGALLVVQAAAFIIATVFGALAARRVVGPTGRLGDSAMGNALDILVIFFGVFIVMLSLFLPSVSQGPGFDYARGIVLILMPSLSAALVLYTAVFKRTTWFSWQVLACAWVAFLGVKDTLAAAAAPTSALRFMPPGSAGMLFIDGMLVFGYSLGFVAVVERMHVRGPLHAHTESTGGTAWPAFAAPATLLVLTPFVYNRLTASEWTQSNVWVIVTVAVGIGLATTARSHLIAAENSSLQRHSTTDPLSGLFNHRHFHERLGVEAQRSRRMDSPLTVVAIDVDDFDRVNNVYGHSAGDRRLRSIAERLIAASRSTDITCRVGGDEFTIIMPDTGPVEAYRVCLRLQDFLHEPDDVCPLPISLSMGIATIPDHAGGAEELVARADGALYWAKFHGRAQIVMYDADLIRSLGPEERIARLEEESYVNMVQLLSSAVDARDPYTNHHSRRVAELSVALARELGLNDDDIAPLETAALLHDVGKIGVPDAVLRKPGPLTAEEYSHVIEHPLLAVRILSAIPRQDILPWIASHHERWDGEGYPAGLAGADIPFMSRIIALCDAYDAMTSDRPYRTGLDADAACTELLACAGTQFDPTLAERFVAMLRRDAAAGRPELAQPPGIAV